MESLNSSCNAQMSYVRDCQKLAGLCKLANSKNGAQSIHHAS